jgi:hypothetical protein
MDDRNIMKVRNGSTALVYKAAPGLAKSAKSWATPGRQGFGATWAWAVSCHARLAPSTVTHAQGFAMCLGYLLVVGTTQFLVCT